ncbi:hypothetical protein T11_8865 [Trichinella zimbabwensis]|uniref:Uncharacterized protein n=1 Tax=Trichinella zimbabwensis TaxID=268475 RepID=A0A0V1HU26_9BILA|nr:hypothetical protein T11_8865 [Trichinella zimbabwensis]
MATRVIYLELVSSLTAQRIIQSDNFTSYKEIEQNLNELVRETHRTLTSKRIEWKYITPAAP